MNFSPSSAHQWLDNAIISILNTTTLLLATVAAVPTTDDNTSSLTASMIKEMVDVCIEESEELQDSLQSSPKRCATANDKSNKKRKLVEYDRERAKQAVHHDYLSPSPIFDDRQFVRFFRITRSKVEWILSCLAKHEPEF